MGDSKEEPGRIIAVVGMCGAGKSAVSDFLQQRCYQFLRFGQITLDEVARRGLQPTEEVEKEIREGLRKEHGMGAFATLNLPKIRDLAEKGKVVLDGLYSWAEYKILKEAFGNEFQVLAVNTSPEIRYSRLENRVIDGKEMRHRPMTREQAKSRDYAEIGNIEKGGPIAMADIMIFNNGTPAELEEQLKGIFQEYPERPSWDEYWLKMAALAAERSTCRRHHVGAVIVREKRLLTTGYNGAPPNEKDCLELGYCSKDKKKLASGVGAEDCKAVHAEENALLQAASFGIPIRGASMYSTHTPCRLCAKHIASTGIAAVTCYHGYEGDHGAIKYLLKRKVSVRQLPRPRSRITFKD